MLNERDLGALRRLLGQILVLVSLLGAFGLEIGATLLVVLSIMLTSAALPLSGRLESVPGWFWKGAPFVLLLVIIGDFILSGGDVLPPLFRTIVILTTFRAVQPRTAREDYQLVLLTLFLLIVTGVLSQEVTFAFQLIGYAPLALGLLFVLNLGHREVAPNVQGSDASPAASAANPDRAASLAGIHWGPVLRRILARLDMRTLLAGLLLCLATTITAFGLFVLMPRFDIGASLPFPRLMTGRSLSGFSDSVQYGDVVSILNDDTIAMRVDFGEGEPPDTTPYWRMVALDAYHAGGFKVSPRVATVRQRLQNYRFEFPSADPNALESPITLYLEGGVSPYLPTADAFRMLLLRNRSLLFFHDLTRVLKAPETNASTLSLRYERASFSGRIPSGEGDILLKALSPLPADTTDTAYLREVAYPQTLLVVPEDAASRRILDQLLSQAGFQPGMDVVTFTDKLLGALQSNRGYSLETRIPEGTADPLLRWIDSGLDGHCELYAGAFVLAARQAGYPARLITGFLGGDWNGFENYYMVRNRHAHAWCEIYSSDTGWLRVDPTPGSGGIRAENMDTLLLSRDRTWLARLDSLRILWFRRVIQFDAQDQSELAGSVTRLGEDSLKRARDWWSAFRQAFRADLRDLVEKGDPRAIARHLAPLLALAAALLVGRFGLRLLRGRRGREARLRKRAAGLLKRLRAEGRADAPIALQVRYGAPESWPRDAEQQLRRYKPR